MGRGLIVILVASLAANIFLGGFVVGRLVNEPADKAVHSADARVERRGGPDRNLEALSPEGREAFRAVFENRREMRAAGREEREALQQNLRAAMVADPFDRNQVEEAMAALADVRNKRHLHQNENLLDALEKMSVADRQIIAARHGRRGDRRGDRRHRRRGDFE